MKENNRQIYDIAIITVLALLYFLASQIRFESTIKNEIISAVIFPSEGIALAFALFFGKKVWPGIFIGQFMIAYGNGIEIIPSIFVSSINSIEAIIAVTLFNKFNLNKNLEEFRDIIGLLLIIFFILQPFSAIMSNLSLYYFDVITKDDMLTSIFSWWFGNVIGQFLYTPFLLTLFNHYKNLNIKDYLFNGIIFGVYIYFLLNTFNISSPLLLLCLTLPILIYVVYKRNIAYGFFMNVIASHILSLNIGPFIYQSGSINIIDYNLYILTTIIVVFSAGMIFENQKKQEEWLQQIIKREVRKNREQQLLMLQQNRLAQMGEIISMIAHQWRQPINNLALLHQLIVSKYKKNSLDDKMIEYFKTNAKQQINMMSNTIDDFRNFFKPQENKKEYYIDEVIENILNIVRQLYSRHNIKISNIQKTKYKCFGYPNSLGHAILNIINNAKDALIEKNVTEKKITITVDEKDGDITITISDNAGGIPEDIIDKVFDPYFSTKNEKNGTGLGLYMTRMIITEHMNSKIFVHNSSEGAVFSIILKGDLCEKIK
ncbi:ATP-binding protein [Hydrogenimonas thermophila]|uniref:histidine kinase n=1 Tax=Hydrogenimonas thermophila TaxID=223786 RepID=A0A1I5UCY6_9BACT|nr:ATP-binding protein [Hydrogenimonas thermophila]WOE69791.1 ATP-binding protein [Hydrogenimonas thermophila]WOE72306.1 ATP-binding protein [Hydrogenimonas thermophila]SFP93109.1 Signal transduction histidine kinase [Hydrogenimonas thermophila]